jgi:hypothetical protein
MRRIVRTGKSRISDQNTGILHSVQDDNQELRMATKNKNSKKALSDDFLDCVLSQKFLAILVVRKGWRVGAG